MVPSLDGKLGERMAAAASAEVVSSGGNGAEADDWRFEGSALPGRLCLPPSPKEERDGEGRRAEGCPSLEA